MKQRKYYLSSRIFGNPIELENEITNIKMAIREKLKRGEVC